jgi:hypothetical protein
LGGQIPPIPHGLGDHARAPRLPSVFFGRIAGGLKEKAMRPLLGAGTYTVAAVAYSHRRCRGHQKGDLHPELHSRVFRLETVVEPAA